MSKNTTFQVLLENDIKREQEQRSKRQKSGKFSPSRTGRCKRFQYWQREDKPESDPIPLAVFKKFRAGNIFHRDLQTLVTRCEVKYEDENWIAFTDHLGDDCCFDFKTVSSFQFKRLAKMSDADIMVDREQEVYQVGCYCYFFNRPFGNIVYVNRDDYSIREVFFPFEYAEKMVKDEIKTMNRYWMNKELPPAKPRAYGGKECNYCIYRTACKELENDKKSAHGKVF